MIWSELYNINNKPSMEDIDDYVNNKLWKELCSYLENTYSVLPKLEYSKCSMQKGWNIKYKKGSKSLCTLYPMNGYFIVLIVISENKLMECDLIIPSCSVYTQNLFSKTSASYCGRWLMIEAREKAVLEDIKRLIQIRVKP